MNAAELQEVSAYEDMVAEAREHFMAPVTDEPTIVERAFYCRVVTAEERGQITSEQRTYIFACMNGSDKHCLGSDEDLSNFP